MKYQRQFDFSRGDQLGLLDAVPISPQVVEEGSSLHKVGAATIRSTLRAIDSHCRGDRPGWPSDKRLALLIDRSERQVRRAVKALEQLKLVVVQSREGRPRLFSIDWGEISVLVRQIKAAKPAAIEPVFFCRTSEPSARTSEPSARTSEPSSDEADLSVKEKRGRNPKAKSDQMCLNMEQALELAQRVSAVLMPRTPNDRQLIAKAAVLAATSLSTQWWEVSLGGVTRCKTRKPIAKFLICCRDHAQKLHDADFDTLCKDIAIPRVFYQRWSQSKPIEVLAKIQPVGRDRRPNMMERHRELLRQAAAEVSR